MTITLMVIILNFNVFAIQIVFDQIPFLSNFPTLAGFTNCDSYHLDTRNKSEFRDQNYLFLSATEGSTTCDLQDQIASDATPASHKRRKIQNTDDTKRESFDPQRRDFLANPTVGLNEQISSSQLKLQQLSIQLQSDLPAFVSRAIQHFSDNNQCLLGEFPHAFFVEQRAFVDQAISVYFSELVPTIPSSAVGSRYDHTLNQDDRTQSTSNSLSSFPLFNGLDDPQLCRLNF